ncbi:unnamed protein product [Jaminaea pallidilutea]
MTDTNTSSPKQRPSYSLAIIGCGTMGVAVLSGILDTQRSLSSSPDNGQNAMDGLASSMEDLQDPADLTYLPSRYFACVSRKESGKRLRSTFPSDQYPELEICVSDNVRAVSEADVVMLGCKPQMAEDILNQQGLREALKGKLLVSICAGLRIEQMEAWVDDSTKVVRAMPNTPSKIREGMTILSTLPPTSEPQDSAVLLSIFSSVGRCRFLPEKHFDACTALAGSGPAFACVFLEAMADGAVMMGLPRKEAIEVAAQSMQGAARMVLQSGVHPATIKDSVTTPGGCTIAGLLALEDGKVRSTVARTIQAAAEHAAGLGQKK